jgi:uncharacterized cupredoxin-like copper-binding protein
MARPLGRIASILLVSVAAAACSGAAAGGPSFTFRTSLPPATATATATAAAVATPAATAGVPAGTITLAEWHVGVASTMHAGKVTFSISNLGTIQHELLVFKSKLAASAYPHTKDGDIVEDGAGVDLLSDGDNIDVGGTQSRTVDLTPGTYLFVCNIPGHFKAGMYQVVTVTP